jgi:hypothetical protein
VPKFLVLYRSSTSANEQIANASPEQSQAGMELWMKWAAVAGDAIVDMGSPLGQVATLGAKDGGKQLVGGFSILEAGSAEQVKELLADHPHFHTPGDASIEILEFLAMPGS